MPYQSIDDRSEREFSWVFNPSAPLTEEDLKNFIDEATTTLLETLSHEEEGSVSK
jgi:hypothetical protein